MRTRVWIPGFLVRAALIAGVLLASQSNTQAANIYVTASGNPAFDTNLQRVLQSFGHSVTFGVAFSDLDGNQDLAGVDTVYLQVNYNWAANDMPAAGQTALVDFVNRGGGLVTTEWFLWRMSGSFFTTLDPIIPANPTTSFDFVDFVTFTQSVPDAELNEGLTAAFSMPLEDMEGTRTQVASIKAGASSFYTMTGGFSALTGWNVGNGRVLTFATPNVQSQLDDGRFQQLLSNAMNWVEQRDTPAVQEGGVANAASLLRGQPVAPGSLVSIFGSDLATSPATSNTLPLANFLTGVSVTFNGVAAPLYFVSPQQINAQLPWAVLGPGTASGTASMVVRRGQGVSQAIPVQVISASPGVFSIDYGVGQAIAFNEDGSLAAPTGSIPGLQSAAARVGSTITILGTGLGAVDPPGRDGQASLDAQRRTLATPTVLIGGVQSQVRFSGLTPEFPGLYQITAIVPQVPPGERVSVQIRIEGITTSDRITIAVRN